MLPYAAATLPTCLVAFMVGNLASIGLEIDLAGVVAACRNLRFVLTVLACDWLLCPALGWLLTRVVPIAEPYAIGLLVIALAPGAPFLPLVVRRAGGDLDYAAAFLALGVLGTVLFMPLLLPLLAPDLAIDAWTIARPLVLLLALPLAAAVALRRWLPALAGRLRNAVRMLATIATLSLLIVVVILFNGGFIAAMGSYAIATQLLFSVVVTVAAHAIAKRLARKQRIVVSLGACSRNLGAAFAPLVAAGCDPRTMVMVALGVPITLIVSFAGALVYARRSG